MLSPPFAVSRPPDLTYQPDVRVTATFGGSSCEYEGPDEISWRQVVAIDIINESDSVAHVTAFEVYEPTSIETVRESAAAGWPDGFLDSGFLGNSSVTPGGTSSLGAVMTAHRLAIRCSDDDSGESYWPSIVDVGAATVDETIEVSFDGETCVWSGPLALTAESVLLRYTNMADIQTATVVMYAPDEPTFEALLVEQNQPDALGQAEDNGREFVEVIVAAPGTTVGLHILLAPGIYTLSCQPQSADVTRYGAVFTVSAP